jgi:hypothetical protein
MSHLHELVERRLVDAGDELYFVFRNNRFTCRLQRGGVLTDCTWRRGHADEEEQHVFSQRGGFSTLTAWADACLHELLDEYISRFSSFKRVRHVPTDITIDELRARSRALKPRGKADQLKVLSDELLREKARTARLMQQLVLHGATMPRIK